MTEVSKVQIIQPTKTDKTGAQAPRAGGAEVRDLVAAGTFSRRPMFSHAGIANARPMVSAPFLAQHLHQEIAGHDAPADAAVASQAYAFAAAAPKGGVSLSA